jgi:hypothetical protein
LKFLIRCLQCVSSTAVFCASLASAQATPSVDPFGPYASCPFSDGLTVIETAPLAPGVNARTVTTLTGPFSVRMTAGRRFVFAFPGEDPYANTKVETLPAEGYLESKAALISDFDRIVATGNASRNYKLKPHLNGFEIQGEDRTKREGGVLGIYLFFDDPTRTVTTIYFLNQEPPKRFQTMEEYGTLRDRFLTEYTACIRAKLK